MEDLANKKYIVSGYDFLGQNLQGEFVGNLTAPLTCRPGSPASTRHWAARAC